MLKRNIIALLLCVSSTGYAQTIQFNYPNWKNEEIQDKINATEKNLAVSLNRTGFTDSDTITINFNWRMEYMQVKSNVVDERRVELLYNQIVVHTSVMRTLIRGWGKMDNLRIFVRVRPDHYLYCDYDTPMFPGERVKIKDKYFK
jgi:hypothetical protein